MTSLPTAEALFHLSVKVIQRSKGRSTVAAAAYRSATTMTDARTAKEFDFRKKKHVVDSFILAPADAPSWTQTQAELWNRVEAAEKRKDAVTAREIELSIPRDLPRERWREFVMAVTKKYITAGAVADVAVHAPSAADDEVQPHAHIMLTPRLLDPSTVSGFAATRNATLAALFESGGRQGGTKGEALKAERSRVAEIVNTMLREVGSERRVDARSYSDRGVDREPEPQIGERRMASVRRRRMHDRRTAVVTAIREYRRTLAELQKTEGEMSQAKHGFPRLAGADSKTDYKTGLLKQRFPDFDPSPYSQDLYMVDVRCTSRTRILMRDGGWIEVVGKSVTTWGTEGKADPLAQALADLVGSDGGVTKLAKSAAVGRTGDSRPLRLAENSAMALADRWRERGYEDVTEAPDGVVVAVGESRLRDAGDYVSVHGALSDEAIRALVEKAADEWGRQLESHGPEDFRERLWLEAQRQGVDVVGYDVPPALRRKWKSEVARKKSDEQILAGVRRIASDADHLIAAAAGDSDSLRKLDPDLRKFVVSYLDDDQRAELAKQRSLDIVAELSRWRELGRAEPDPEHPETAFVSRPTMDSAPEEQRRPT